MDVTLRDGGYQTNFSFNNDVLTNILTFLDQSNIEYIEIGYRNGSVHPINNIGDAGLCHADYLQLCRSILKKSKMTVMLHPHNVKESDLDELKSHKVDTLRICLSKGKEKEAFEIIKKSKDRNFEVSVNITRISHYDEDALDNLISKVIQHPVDIIYFADSNGSMLPTKTLSLYKKYISKTPIPFGFHAHDNLGLAQANTLAAIEAGVKYIDSALSGFGKGIGNLKTEFFVAYLHALNIKFYDINKLLQACNYVKKKFNPASNIKINEFRMGIEDLSIDDILKLNKIKRSASEKILLADHVYTN
jgi:4-hydroxy 2-oxovalerate aldolase